MSKYDEADKKISSAIKVLRFASAYCFGNKKEKNLVLKSVRSAKLLLDESELLLNEQPEAITEDSHFRKHDVGRSAASEEITTVKNDASESSSEMQAVGQNEKQDKTCPDCWGSGWEIQFIKPCRRCNGSGQVA